MSINAITGTMLIRVSFRSIFLSLSWKVITNHNKLLIANTSLVATPKIENNKNRTVFLLMTA